MGRQSFFFCFVFRLVRVRDCKVFIVIRGLFSVQQMFLVVEVFICRDVQDFGLLFILIVFNFDREKWACLSIDWIRRVICVVCCWILFVVCMLSNCNLLLIVIEQIFVVVFMWSILVILRCKSKKVWVGNLNFIFFCFFCVVQVLILLFKLKQNEFY